MIRRTTSRPLRLRGFDQSVNHEYHEAMNANIEKKMSIDFR